MAAINDPTVWLNYINQFVTNGKESTARHGQNEMRLRQRRPPNLAGDLNQDLQIGNAGSCDTIPEKRGVDTRARALLKMDYQTETFLARGSRIEKAITTYVNGKGRLG